MLPSALKKMYGISLIVVFVVISFEHIVHKGLKYSVRDYRTHMNKRSVFISSIKSCLVITIAVLSSKATDIHPRTLAIIGACVVFVFLVLRIAQDEFIDNLNDEKNEEHVSSDSDEHEIDAEVAVEVDVEEK